MTERCRYVMAHAGELARRYGHNVIDVEHVQVALAEERNCVAALILDEMGVDPGSLHQSAKFDARKSQALAAYHLPLSEDLEQWIGQAKLEAAGLEEYIIGPEHLLLSWWHHPRADDETPLGWVAKIRWQDPKDLYRQALIINASPLLPPLPVNERAQNIARMNFSVAHRIPDCRVIQEQKLVIELPSAADEASVDQLKEELRRRDWRVIHSKQRCRLYLS